ncbi:uncharacterized protein LOC110464265 isoform X2 [Mizuhopecten yessoensis]|uniref:uncharacterized protein LOC110464265 isoform X2 n=1 Tax=Mizuhopecten yessoensis TaxID=6573 RepID=UPI000B45F35F|nr:uncharacterized protein LOC110464265 isoform X2 [Mizuhopecten yessoensis]
MTDDTRDARIPVDRSWAWMVLAEFLRTFKGTVMMTVLINTVLTVVYCITASSLLLIGFKRLSVRASVFLGIILCAIGYSVSSFATGLDYLIASQSILIGTGNALHNPPIFMLIGEYFDKKKGLANAIFISGNSLGGIIMPPLYRYVFDKYGLRGGPIITAGITLNSLVAAALLRPTEFYTRNIPQKSTQGSEYVEKESPTNENNAKETPPNDCLGDSNNLYPLISTKRAKQHSPHDANDTNDIVDKISRSSIVRYLSNGDLASSSVSSLPGRIDHRIIAMDGEHFKTETSFLVKCKNKIDCTLMKNVLFILFLTIYCFGNVAIMCAHIYIPTYARDIGIDDQRIAIIVSIMSVTDFVGRILAGYLADLSSITPHWVVILSQIVVGVVLQFTVYYTSFWRLVVFVAIFGSTAGMIAALFPPMMIEIVGMKRYRSAMAVFIICVCLFNGLALPVLGYFRDVTNTFHFSFHVMGASSFVAIVLLIVFDVIVRKRARKKKLDLEIN